MKVCCIRSIEEAKTAVDLGASALGLVSAMPSGPGVIPETVIASIAAFTPANVESFLLTSHTDPLDVIHQFRLCNTTTIQLCDALPVSAYSVLRDQLPHVRLVQVLHVVGAETIDEVDRLANHVDALLLDSGNVRLATKELGGTGRTHDWSVSAEIVARSPLPVWLAGGLNASNVIEAVDTVAPFGVDLCSGVRTNGALDRQKLSAFMAVLSVRSGVEA